MRIEVLIDVKTILGEGPLWDVDEQRLFFIDSFGCNVFRCTADGREVRAWDVPAKIGSMALRKQGGAVLSLANGFHFLDFKTGETSLIRAGAAASSRIPPRYCSRYHERCQKFVGVQRLDPG